MVQLSRFNIQEIYSFEFYDKKYINVQDFQFSIEKITIFKKLERYAENPTLTLEYFSGFFQIELVNIEKCFFRTILRNTQGLGFNFEKYLYDRFECQEERTDKKQILTSNDSVKYYIVRQICTTFSGANGT